MNGKIKIELLSDACIGNGLSVSGIVDNDVSYDKYGIPYIPAKRILGIMRDEAKILCQYSGRDTKIIDKLFGQTGADESGTILLGNANIEGIDEFISNLEYAYSKKKNNQILSPGNILDYFTTIRTQTAIENGVAKDDTLRVTRVIKKGNIFYCPLTVENCSEEEKTFIKDIIQCIRHIGAQRNRGLGHVSCKLEENLKNSENDLSKRSLKTNAKQIQYTVTLLSDCVLDKDYISASTVLGVCVAKYLKKYGKTKKNVHEDPLFQKLFLSDEVVITDAYPAIEKKLSIPVPKCFYCQKDRTGSVYNLLEHEVEADNQYVRPIFNYCDLKETYVFPVEIEKSIQFHHKRNSNPSVGSAGKLDSVLIQEDDGQFYEYESVVKGTRFSGIIQSETENLELIWDLLNNQEAMIGRSKKVQYGKCIFELMNKEEENIEKIVDISEDKVSLILLSDLVIFNNYGEPTLQISDIESVMKIQLDEGIKIDKDRCYLSKNLQSGFNRKHKLPTPVFNSIERGSIITIDINLVKDKKTLFHKISKTAIGEYIKFGFGRMNILPNQENEELCIKKFEPKIRLRKNESELFQKVKRELDKKSFYLRGIKKLYCGDIKYFNEIKKVLSEQKNKSQMRFLYELCKNTNSIEQIKVAIEEKIKKESMSKRRSTPYTDLEKVLSLSNNQVIKEQTYRLFELEGEQSIDLYYMFAIATLCEKVALERRYENE